MEISITKLTLNKPFHDTSLVTVVAELIWPRPAIGARSGVKALPLRRGKASLSRKPYFERLMLKERVDGNFGLTIGITRPGSPASAAAAEIIGTALSALGSGLSAALTLPSTSLRSLVREPFGQLADLVEDDELTLIAQAGIDLNSEEDFTGKKTLELKTLKSLRIPTEPKSGPRTKNIPKKQKTVSVRKGTVIGSVEVELRES